MMVGGRLSAAPGLVGEPKAVVAGTGKHRWGRIESEDRREIKRSGSCLGRQ